MTFYRGPHAEMYDVFYADKPYGEEAAFVHELLQRHANAPVRRLLELACGTGRHALLFEERGYEVIALDTSEDMVAVARRRASSAGSGVDFRVADMRALNIEGPPFDAVVCLFDSIGYAQSNDAVDNVLAGVRKHLRPGGLFILEFWHAAAMLRGYDRTRVRRWRVDDREIVRISETELEPRRQLAHVKYTIFDLGSDGRFRRIEETQTNRFFLVQEMHAFLTRAGMSPLAWHDGFSNGRRLDQDTWHILGVAQKPI
jgi:SAM-dependent methyltransferase